MIEDDLLHLAVHSSLRIGEAMALSWDDVDFVKKEIHIRKTLQRVSKQALEELPSESLYFTFPPKQLDKKTVLIVKKPKTDSSKRTLYITDELCAEMLRRKEKIERQKQYYGNSYMDYNLVFSLEDGYPIEPKLCEKWFKKWQNGPGLAFPDIVFHSIRHSSTTYKLTLSHGDIKSSTGRYRSCHSSDRNRYIRTYAGEFPSFTRREIGERFLSGKSPTSSESAVPVDAESLLLMIQQNPDLKNFLLAGVLADDSTKVQQMLN